MLKLDSRDLEILRQLARNGRISKAELAKRVNLSPSPCWERLKRLEDAGVIDGYHAEISLRKIAAHIVVFVVAELESHQAESFAAFEQAVSSHDEIVSCWALGGGFDYLLQVVTRDIESYQGLIDGLLEQDVGLARYYTYVVTKPVKLSSVPPLDMLLPGEPG